MTNIHLNADKKVCAVSAPDEVQEALDRWLISKNSEVEAILNGFNLTSRDIAIPDWIMYCQETHDTP